MIDRYGSKRSEVTKVMIMVWLPIAKRCIDIRIRTWACSYALVVVLNVGTPFTFTIDIIHDLDLTYGNEDPFEVIASADSAVCHACIHQINIPLRKSIIQVK